MPPKPAPEPAPWFTDPLTGERLDRDRPPCGGTWIVDPATGERILTEPPHPPPGLRFEKAGERFRLVPDAPPEA